MDKCYNVALYKLSYVLITESRIPPYFSFKPWISFIEISFEQNLALDTMFYLKPKAIPALWK